MKALIVLALLMFFVHIALTTPVKLIKWFTNQEWSKGKFSLIIAIVTGTLAAVFYKIGLLDTLIIMFGGQYEPSKLTFIFDMYVTACIISQGLYAFVDNLGKLIPLLGKLIEFFTAKNGPIEKQGMTVSYSVPVILDDSDKIENMPIDKDTQNSV